MKKRLTFVLAVILAFSALAGCSAGYNSGSDSVNYAAPTEAYYGGDYYDNDSAYEEANAEKGISTGESAMPTTAADFSEKMIYTASAEIETTDFDGAVKAVSELIENYGGFLESSYMTGQSYSSKWNGYEPRRYASFVIRVPSAGYRSMTESLSVLGNVTLLREESDNITVQFYDTQSRLDTYRVEEQRGMAMLEKAETVSEMLELEARLGEIRYNIESLESRLRNWQNQVDYSTVTLNISEVQELTATYKPGRSYWERMGDGFMETLKDIGEFFTDLFMDIVVSLPVLIILAAVIVAIVLTVRALLRKRKAKKQQKTDTQ